MKKFILLILSFLVLFGMAFNEEDINLRADQVVTNAFPEIRMTFSAWQMNGLPLTNLTPQDITLQEDDGPAFHPEALTINEDAPLSVVLIMDVSGSMQGKPLVDAKAAAARFLDRLSGGDQAALVAFSHNVNPDPARLAPEREITFTQNLTIIYDTIENLTADGGTELYHAVEKGVRMAQFLPVGHRAVLVLSDGVNEPVDAGDPDAPITLARNNGIPVYVIGLGNLIDEPYLRRLAAETGGYFRLTPKSSELAQTFDDMAALLKTTYTLVYTSTLAGAVDNAALTFSVESQGSKVLETVDLGPLPEVQAPEPEVAEPTAEVVTPTAIPEPTRTAFIVTEPAPSSEGMLQSLPWWAWLLGAAVVILILAQIFKAIKKRKPTPEKCAQCGFDMTGKHDPCPQCGSTRRLPKV